MKKITALFIFTALLLSLCSCNLKPDKTSDAMYQIGLNALDLADQYIAGKITGEEAYARIEEFSKQAKAQEDYDRELLGLGEEDGLATTEYSNDYFISFDISMLSFDIMQAYHGSDSMAEVKESRDELAEQLGK